METRGKRKASYFKIAAPGQESFRYLRVSERNLGAPWHFHPEYQLTLVLRGRGHRLVGDNLAPLVPCDLTLLGPNLPHFWHTHASLREHPRDIDAMMVHFREDFLGADFFRRPELAVVAKMLQGSVRGLHFKGRLAREIALRLEQLAELAGMDRLLALLNVLHLLAQARGAEPISSATFTPQLDHTDQGRLERVFRHVHEHLAEPIFREELARLAGLSPRTFSRYFRQKMGKSLPQFINELRIGAACRQLMEANLTIAEIALHCGFENLANFNTHFRRFKGCAPREFRDRALAGTKP